MVHAAIARHNATLMLITMLSVLVATATFVDAQTGRLIAQAKFGDNHATMWSPTLEWSLTNDSYEGNPFDLVAKVTFAHESGKEKRVTKMFRAEDNVWKFRFTGTRTGKWTFNTKSNDSDLDGRSGTVTVRENEDPNIYGFMTHHVGPDGTKWARFRGSDGSKEAFVPQLVMYRDKPEQYHDQPEVVDADITEFLGRHGFTGFHLKGPNWMTAEEPNMETFEAVELLLRKTHVAGGVVHIWCYGDGGGRHWGRNTEVDKRFQRYLCARFGPLPGWSMGYGFDTYHIPAGESEQWYRYMHEHLGWFHHLGIRPACQGTKGRRMNKQELQEWNRTFDYTSSQDYQPDYEDYVDWLGFVEGQPLMMEDRFRIRGWEGSGKNYTIEQTRRGLWHSTLAGGSANIWANLTKPDGSYTKGGQSHSYPNAEQLKTYSAFFFDNHRFRKDLQRDNDRTDGYCLRDGQTHYIFYKENTSSIEMDLSGMSGPQSAVAVDATKKYREIDIGPLKPGSHTWNAPHNSDWAIAVGHFSSQGAPSSGPSEQERELQLEPCKIELVDGSTVSGQLAAQFEMGKHVIVYSPHLATMRSFLKQHIHAMVVDGKREQFNPKRELTEREKEPLGRIDWPDEPPEKSRSPAYCAETWKPPRQLLVWANPGRSGRLEESQNWLLNGKPLSSVAFRKEERRADGDAFDLNTDILLPDAATSYTVGYSNRARGGLKARHITVGDNAQLKASILTVAGNVRIVPRGRLRVRYTIALKGDRHTFFHNDKPPFTAQQNNALQGGYPAANYVNGIGYSVAQYFRVEKVGLASVEFIGTTQTSDDFQMPSGVTIVAPNAQLMPGKRSTQRIGKDAVLRLHSGCTFCKAENATYYDNDLIVEGRIEAGTNEHPITRDCLLGISFKDRSCYGKDGPSVGRAAPGLVFKPTAGVEVHTIDPKTAKLIICWHGRENTWQRSRMKSESGKNYMDFPRKIEVEVHGQLALNAVLFDDVHGGGIKLAYPGVRNLWKNVFFGNNNEGPPNGLFNLLPAKGKKGND